MLIFYEQEGKPWFRRDLHFWPCQFKFSIKYRGLQEYTGDELLLEYTSVKDRREFNIKNVFFNQKMETHTPLYYLIVKIICSLKKGTFSIWYALIINIIFIVILYFQTSYCL